MAAILLVIGLVVLGVVGGLAGADSRDSSNWNWTLTGYKSHNR
jgi:hypothetical protein